MAQNEVTPPTFPRAVDFTGSQFSGAFCMPGCIVVPSALPHHTFLALGVPEPMG